MRVPKPAAGVRLPLLFAILPLFILAGAVPALAVKYAHKSPLSFRWTPASGVVDHYNVYLSEAGNPFKLLKKAVGNTCQVDVKDGRTYVLQVEAEDALGRVGPMSNPSDQVAVYLNGSQGDTDGDGMPDAWEVSQSLNPFDPKDAPADPDRDGLTSLDEFLRGTKPKKRDSDGDGLPDREDPYPLDSVNGGTNGRPVANAGPDQVLNPTVVTLDGSGSRDQDGDRLTYSLTQKAGPKVRLSKSDAVKPTFIGTKSGNYVFELVVSDGKLASLPDQVVVTVRNVPPAADAGLDLEAYVGAQVLLDGSGSADPNEDSLRFMWIQRSGPLVMLQGALEQVASFVPAQAGVYVFRLVTFDGLLFSPTDEVQVTVNSSANQVPRADAGKDQRAKVGETVTLDGSGSSDPDGDPLSFAWSRVKGPASVVLEGAATARARFQAGKRGSYEFRLIVSDGELSSPPDTVKVVVAGEDNEAPVAVIMEKNSKKPVKVRDWVVLDGSQSHDPDGIGYLSYKWSQTKGPEVALEDGDRAVAGFYAVTEGTLAFELVVQDGESESLPASVGVQVVAVSPDQAERPAKRPADSGDGGGGCSVVLGGGPNDEVGATDIGYIVLLFLPAFAAGWVQKHKLRRRKGTSHPFA